MATRASSSSWRWDCSWHPWAFRFARWSPDDKIAAFVSIAIVVIYLIQAYGDMGVSSSIGVFLVGGAGFCEQAGRSGRGVARPIRSRRSGPPTSEVAS